MKPKHLTIVFLMLLGGCRSTGDKAAIPKEPFKWDSAHIHDVVIISANGVAGNLLNDSTVILHKIIDSLKWVIAGMNYKNGDVGEIYVQDKRILDSLADDKKMQRYCDSIDRYLRIRFNSPVNSKAYNEADKVFMYYNELLGNIDEKYPKPNYKIPKPKDMTIYPPKP